MNAIYILPNKFTVAGDRTSEFTPNRRLKLTISGTSVYDVYDVVSSSTYGVSYTTVTTVSGGLTNELTQVLYGIVDSGYEGGLPDHTHSSVEGSGGVLPDIYTITEDLELYISVSGSDTVGDGSLANPYATFTGPWNYIKYKRIQPDKYVTIRYLDGVHTLTSQINLTLYNSRYNVNIYGSTVLDRSITSVQSSSGSSGAYSIIFNLNTVSDVSIGDYVLVGYNAAGGTNPTYACGVHEITNIDVPNNRITVTSKHRKGAPAGAVTASVKIFKTVLTSTDIVAIYASSQGFTRIGGFALIGMGTGTGLSATNHSVIYCTTPVAISGFTYGAACTESSVMTLSSCGVSGASGNSIYVQETSLINGYRMVVTGGGNHGILSQYQSTYEGSPSVSTGHVAGGFVSYASGIILCDASSATGNGAYGWSANYGSIVKRTGTCVGGNNTSGDTYTANGGLIQTA